MEIHEVGAKMKADYDKKCKMREQWEDYLPLECNVLAVVFEAAKNPAFDSPEKLCNLFKNLADDVIAFRGQYFADVDSKEKQE